MAHRPRAFSSKNCFEILVPDGLRLATDVDNNIGANIAACQYAAYQHLQYLQILYTVYLRITKLVFQKFQKPLQRQMQF